MNKKNIFYLLSLVLVLSTLFFASCNSNSSNNVMNEYEEIKTKDIDKKEDKQVEEIKSENKKEDKKEKEAKEAKEVEEKDEEKEKLINKEVKIDKEKIIETKKEIKEEPEEKIELKQEDKLEKQEEKEIDIPKINISINCGTINNNLEDFNPDKIDLIKDDGIILSSTDVEFTEGETVFDILSKVTKDNNIHFEFSKTPAYDAIYIEGIANIYEFDCGELSGWMYSVNDIFPGVGISKYVLEDGDIIKILYTCDLGRDIGNEFN